MIKKITIEINGKETDLTPEEARKLFNELYQLFGPKVTTPVYTPDPYISPGIPQTPYDHGKVTSRPQREYVFADTITSKPYQYTAKVPS